MNFTMHTVSEAADILKRSKYTIREWIKAGKFPNARRVGRFWLIPHRDIHVLLNPLEGEEE